MPRLLYRGPALESMSGPLLPLYFGSAKLAAVLDAWLGNIKASAERAAAGGPGE